MELARAQICVLSLFALEGCTAHYVCMSSHRYLLTDSVCPLCLLHDRMLPARQGMWIATFPYKLGIFTSVSAAFVSIPLVFDLDTALWFNENFVTTEVAEDKDLETWLEVGSWTWSWNEPVLGTVSFVLLALQFARNQMLNLGAKPYTGAVKNWRAK